MQFLISICISKRNHPICNPTMQKKMSVFMFIRVSSQSTFLGPINAVAHHGKGNVNSLRSKVHDQILTSQQFHGWWLYSSNPFSLTILRAGCSEITSETSGTTRNAEPEKALHLVDHRICERIYTEYTVHFRLTKCTNSHGSLGTLDQTSKPNSNLPLIDQVGSITLGALVVRLVFEAFPCTEPPIISWSDLELFWTSLWYFQASKKLVFHPIFSESSKTCNAVESTLTTCPSVANGASGWFVYQMHSLESKIARIIKRTSVFHTSPL